MATNKHGYNLALTIVASTMLAACGGGGEGGGASAPQSTSLNNGSSSSYNPNRGESPAVKPTRIGSYDAGTYSITAHTLVGNHYSNRDLIKEVTAKNNATQELSSKNSIHTNNFKLQDHFLSLNQQYKRNSVLSSAQEHYQQAQVANRLPLPIRNPKYISGIWTVYENTNHWNYPSDRVKTENQDIVTLEGLYPVFHNDREFFRYLSVRSTESDYQTTEATQEKVGSGASGSSPSTVKNGAILSAVNYNSRGSNVASSVNQGSSTTAQAALGYLPLAQVLSIHSQTTDLGQNLALGAKALYAQSASGTSSSAKDAPRADFDSTYSSGGLPYGKNLLDGDGVSIGVFDGTSHPDFDNKSNYLVKPKFINPKTRVSKDKFHSLKTAMIIAHAQYGIAPHAKITHIETNNEPYVKSFKKLYESDPNIRIINMSIGYPVWYEGSKWHTNEYNRLRNRDLSSDRRDMLELRKKGFDPLVVQAAGNAGTIDDYTRRFLHDQNRSTSSSNNMNLSGTSLGFGVSQKDMNFESSYVNDEVLGKSWLLVTGFNFDDKGKYPILVEETLKWFKDNSLNASHKEKANLSSIITDKYLSRNKSNLKDVPAGPIYPELFAVRCGTAMFNCLTAYYRFTTPHLTANGTTTLNGRTYSSSVRSISSAEFPGTSGAAPQVSGIAALVAQNYPWMRGPELKTTLLSTATDIGKPGIDEVFGWGLVNAERALKGPAMFFFDNFNADMRRYAYGGKYLFSNSISGTKGMRVNGKPHDWLFLIGQQNTYQGATLIESGNLVVTSAKHLGLDTNPGHKLGYHSTNGFAGFDEVRASYEGKNQKTTSLPTAINGKVAREDVRKEVKTREITETAFTDFSNGVPATSSYYGYGGSYSYGSYGAYGSSSLRTTSVTTKGVANRTFLTSKIIINKPQKDQASSLYAYDVVLTDVINNSYAELHQVNLNNIQNQSGAVLGLYLPTTPIAQRSTTTATTHTPTLASSNGAEASNTSRTTASNKNLVVLDKIDLNNSDYSKTNLKVSNIADLGANSTLKLYLQQNLQTTRGAGVNADGSNINRDLGGDSGIVSELLHGRQYVLLAAKELYGKFSQVYLDTPLYDVVVRTDRTNNYVIAELKTGNGVARRAALRSMSGVSLSSMPEASKGLGKVATGDQDVVLAGADYIDNLLDKGVAAGKALQANHETTTVALRSAGLTPSLSSLSSTPATTAPTTSNTPTTNQTQAIKAASLLTTLSGTELQTIMYSLGGTVYANLQLATANQALSEFQGFSRVVGRYAGADKLLHTYFNYQHGKDNWTQANSAIKGKLNRNALSLGAYLQLDADQLGWTTLAQKYPALNLGFSLSKAESNWNETLTPSLTASSTTAGSTSSAVTTPTQPTQLTLGSGTAKALSLNLAVGIADTQASHNLTLGLTNYDYHLDLLSYANYGKQSQFKAWSATLGYGYSHKFQFTDNFKVIADASVFARYYRQQGFNERQQESSSATTKPKGTVGTTGNSSTPDLSFLNFNSKAKSKWATGMSFTLEASYTSKFDIAKVDWYGRVKFTAVNGNNFSLNLTDDQQTAVGFKQNFLSELTLGTKIQLTSNLSIKLSGSYQKANQFNDKKLDIGVDVGF